MNLKTTHIRFFATVNHASVRRLMQTVESKVSEGVRRFVILMSSPGRTVYHGLSVHNFLKGVPVEVTTHNFGGVDSIGVVIYCAGAARYCVPHARFLLHGVSAQFPSHASLEEEQLEERLSGLRIDTENIAGVVAANTGKSEDEVHRAILDRTTLNPSSAKEWGLVHGIREELFPAGSELISIEDA
jgi:ATP-dependent protease ClpP protease subunit